MLNILIFLVVLSILVLAHELGHFLAAKYSRVRVEEFALGFPPTIYSQQKGETKYMINLIPFGGYVKMFGEDGTHQKNKDSFAYKNWLTKIFIVSAGVIMNLVLGSLLLGIVLMFGLPVISDNVQSAYPGAQITPEAIVYDVPEDHSMANQIRSGDKIVAVNDQTINSIKSFKDSLQTIQNQPYQITVERDSSRLEVSALSIFNEQSGEWQIGLDLIEGSIVKYPFYLAIPMGIVEMFRMLWMMIVALFMILYNLIVTQSVPSQIAGPVGIYKLTAEASAMGITYLMQMMAILSINLAIINFLPIPALDGGRVIFIIGERLFGKKMSANTENIIHMIGFFAIIALLIIVTIRDVQKFF